MFYVEISKWNVELTKTIFHGYEQTNPKIYLGGIAEIKWKTVLIVGLKYFTFQQSCYLIQLMLSSHSQSVLGYSHYIALFKDHFEVICAILYSL